MIVKSKMLVTSYSRIGYPFSSFNRTQILRNKKKRYVKPDFIVFNGSSSKRKGDFGKKTFQRWLGTWEPGLSFEFHQLLFIHLWINQVRFYA